MEIEEFTSRIERWYTAQCRHRCCLSIPYGWDSGTNMAGITRGFCEGWSALGLNQQDKPRCMELWWAQMWCWFGYLVSMRHPSFCAHCGLLWGRDETSRGRLWRVPPKSRLENLIAQGRYRRIESCSWKAKALRGEIQRRRKHLALVGGISREQVLVVRFINILT